MGNTILRLLEPFTGEIMNNISEAFLAPYDWYSLARTTLDGDYLLWKGEYLEKS